MFKVGDTVMYVGSGVCQIADIRPETFSGRQINYYVLRPVDSENATYYCPVESNKIKMRPLLTRDEILELIQHLPEAETDWIENDQLRKIEYGKVLKDGEPGALMRMIRALYLDKEQKRQMGRKFHVADEKVMREAERMLHGELAYVLHLNPDQVVSFIARELQKAGPACISGPDRDK